MQRVFDLINGAKQAVLFLAFDPGNNSILDAAGKALAKNPDLFVRGALTSSVRALNFSAALHQGGATESGTDGDVGGHASHAGGGVIVVGEPGQPKKKGAKLPSSAGPDLRAVPAGAVTKDDAFGAWEGELAKYGFAIIHNKIVVIDPFSDNCTVVTGSHNLGFRASHNNDENMVIIRGHRALAEAYACHVLDLYDHYAWRFLLKQHPDIFGKPLEDDDKWQERYITGPDVKSPELRFWLAAAKDRESSTSGTAAPRGKPSAAAVHGQAVHGQAVHGQVVHEQVIRGQAVHRQGRARQGGRRRQCAGPEDRQEEGQESRRQGIGQIYGKEGCQEKQDGCKEDSQEGWQESNQEGRQEKIRNAAWCEKTLDQGRRSGRPGSGLPDQLHRSHFSMLTSRW